MESVRETSPSKHQPGLYRHPESGAEVVVKSHPKFGSAQADGFVRVGYQYVGPAPEKAEESNETKKGSK